MTDKKKRDYQIEHARRMLRNKRLIADLDREKVESFQAYLKSQGVTFASWLDSQINQAIKEVK